MLSGADNGYIGYIGSAPPNGGRNRNTTITDDLAAFGLDDTQHGQQIVLSDDTDIWACNVNILTLFMFATTQLRTSFGGVVGLDYTAVKCISQAMDITWDLETMQGVQACEQVLLEVINR